MRITELFGIDLPIIQAPLAGVQGSTLAIAVCRAGGLGSLPCAMLAPEAIGQEVAAIAAATDRPYNLNFFCHTAPTPDPTREARWRAALAPYYAEFGIDPAGIAAGPGRLPFSDEIADLIEPCAPRIVSFHFGLPAPRLVGRVHAWGASILASATTVDEARWLEAHGADVIIAQGLEAGGHRGHFLERDLNGQMRTFELLPRVLAATRLPVIAAGGIATPAAVAAALQQGAAGVQVGTAYMLCPEATTSPLHRAALRAASGGDTRLTNLFTGRPARGIENRLMRELGPLSDLPPDFPLATAALGPLRAKAEALGRSDFSPLWAGESVAAISEESAAALTRRLAGGEQVAT
ncbi:MAG: Nitronate monooxygenase [Candidatus Accumulibacter adjunctus]|uniref:Nitronate monooxygenase n=1 Tax=Candidatus Accumulibacter adjunctus TaxID=1454001 RepID=A0A011NIG1_9PROT|nr:MAG: Nitronate monooxygenase [Candidatus Accumulibacter adjunctus]